MKTANCRWGAALGVRVCAFLTLIVGSSAADERFILRNQRAGGYLWSIASDGSRLVTVGTEGRILTSADGVVWIARSSGTTDWLVGVAYGNGRFIAVGDRGRILTSPTGETWTTVPNVPTTARLNNAVFGPRSPGGPTDGIWVAVGEAGTALVSTDQGSTWRSGTTGVTGWLRGLTSMVTRSYVFAPKGGGTGGLASIRYFAEVSFVATGQGGSIVTSTDGLAWTSLNSGTSEDLEAITGTYSTFFGGLNHAVAIGSNGVVRTYDAPHAYFVGDLTNGYTGPPPTFPSYAAWQTGSFGVAADIRFRGLARHPSGDFSSTPILLASGERGVVTMEGTVLPTGVTRNLVASVYHRDRFYVVGEDETILQQVDAAYLSTLGNLSTRGSAGGSRGIMIGGIVVGGNVPKRILVRAAGPALATFGVEGVMPEPTLVAYDTAGRSFASNRGWSDDATVASAAQTAGAFAFAPGSKDAAMVLNLAPGAYTFFVQPAGGSAPGVALFEAYDADPPSNAAPRLLNVSTGGYVGAGRETLISGVVIAGSARGNVLIRGIGPSLRDFGVAEAVDDCEITVYRGNQVIASNDNWGTSPNATQLTLAFSQVGAFSLDESGKDAALILSNLAPGAYTVMLTSKSSAAGRGMIEIYELP